MESNLRSTQPEQLAPPGWEKTKDWFWEGNVQNKIVTYLREKEGYVNIEQSEMSIIENGIAKRKHKKGPDIIAQGLSGTKIVEVKGYPSQWYTDEKRRGQPKKTGGNTEARHNFDGALFQVTLDKCNNHNADVSIGLPDYPIYRKQIKKVRWFLQEFNINFYFVTNNDKDSVRYVNVKELTT